MKDFSEITKRAEYIAKNCYMDGEYLDNFLEAYPDAYEASGSFRRVFIFDDCEWVLKVPKKKEKNSLAICKKEVYLYEAAAEDPFLGELFAECRYLTTIDDIPFFVMLKAECDHFEIEDSIEEWHDKSSTRLSNADPGEEENVLTFIHAQLCPDHSQRFSNFYYDYELFDIHSENIGFLQGKIKIIDYAGVNPCYPEGGT